MSSKEVYDEIFGDYVNSERHKEDFEELGGAALYERVEDILKQTAPEQYYVLWDAISELMYEILQTGFYFGVREAFRHLMRAEVAQ